MSRRISLLLPLLIVVVLSISFFGLGSVKLFDVDEAVFSEATKEMVQNGDWITPTYNGANRYDKPVLFYWLMAVSYKLFGINEFAARFPSAVAGVLLCITLFLFLYRVSGPVSAMSAVMALASSVYYFVYSHSAVTDMSLTLFITLSVICFYVSVSGRETSGAVVWGHLGFYLFSSLAFLTKGLIGIVFPFAIALIYLTITEKGSGAGRIFKRIFSFKGALLFIIVSGPWYTAEFSANGMEFIRQFFIKHHFVRYTGVISGHSGPFYYYIPVIIIGLLPWIAFLPQGIKTALNDGRVRGIIRRCKPATDEIPEMQSHSVELFALVWFSVIFLFFSFSTTKLPNYILGSLPAAAILIASGMSANSIKSRRYSHIFIVVITGAVAAGLLAAPRFLAKAGINDTGWTTLPALIMVAVSITSLYSVFSGRTLYPVIAAMMAAFIISLSATALPLAAEQLQGTLYKFSIYAKENLGADGRLITYRLNKPSVVFYADRRTTSISNPYELSPFLNESGKKLVIAKSGDADKLIESGLTLIEKDKQYALLGKD